MGVLPSRKDIQIKNILNYKDMLEHFEFLYNHYVSIPKVYIDLRAIYPVQSVEYKRRSDLGLSPSGGSMFFPITDTGIHNAVLWCIENQKDKDIMLGVLPRNGEGRSLYNVTHQKHLWIELDGVEKYGPQPAYDYLLKRCSELNIPNPHWVNYTRKGVHAYWEILDIHTVHTDETRNLLRSVLLRLCYGVGNNHNNSISADPATCHVGGILRPCQTLNHKNIQFPIPIVNRVKNLSEQPMSLQWWRSSLPRLPESQMNTFQRTTNYSNQNNGEVMPLPEYAKRIAAGDTGTQGRNVALTTLLGVAVKCNWSDSALETLTINFCNNTGLSMREGNAVLKSALKNFKERR